MTAPNALATRPATLTRWLDRGRWYTARLKAMPAAELSHRLAEAGRHVAWRRRRDGWEAFASIGDGAVADLSTLRARLARVDASDAGVMDSARRTREGRFSFLGENWPRIDCAPDQALQIPRAFWFHDPISKRAWPDAASSSFAIDVRSTGADIGDVKYVWEPNRLQILHPIAALVADTQDPALRGASLAVIADWAAANPPYRGVNWKSGIELALRLVSLALVIAAAPTLQVEERVMLRRMIVAHARYLAAFPSLHSSANNHRVAEGLGLFIAGGMVPDLDREHGWLGEGRRILETEAVRQILADGVGAEQSPTYQAFTMEMLALAALLAPDFGAALDPVVRERLARGAEFLSRLCDANGLPPRIGDDDEGRVIAQPPDREPRYVASVVAAVAGLLQRPELARARRDPHLRDRIFASPAAPPHDRDGAVSTAAAVKVATQGEVSVFEQGGWSIVKDTIAGRRIHLVFDHGALGLLPLAAHGHADALAIWLSIDGQPVFVDAGSYRYFSGGEIRTALRESLAHNTAAIQGLSHSRATGAFGWRTIATGELLGFSCEPLWWIAGAHDGYQKRFGVRQVRKIRRLPAGIALEDRVAGARRPLPATLRFLIAPGLTLARDSDAVTIHGGRGMLCRIVPPQGFAAAIAAAQCSPGFGQLVPAQRLVLTGALTDQPSMTQIGITGAAPAHDRNVRLAMSTDAATAEVE